MSPDMVEFYSTASADSINYGNLAIGDTMMINLGQEFHFTDIIIAYDNYYPAASLFPFVLVPKARKLVNFILYSSIL